MNSSHIITVDNGHRKQLKCLHCGKHSNLKVSNDLIKFAKELLEFEKFHTYCVLDLVEKPTPITTGATILCLICGKKFKQMEGKVPLYRDSELNPFYTHVKHVYDTETLERLGDPLGIFETYQIGHHDIVVQSQDEWLYFWQGSCGVARNKKEALQQLEKLRSEL